MVTKSYPTWKQMDESDSSNVSLSALLMDCVMKENSKKEKYLLLSFQDEDNIISYVSVWHLHVLALDLVKKTFDETLNNLISMIGSKFKLCLSLTKKRDQDDNIHVYRTILQMNK